MINIKSLNKVYKSKKRRRCHALHDINLTLPDAGLVFVLGKSGSGKSTLLNLIGGLDNVTSGSIEVDGNDLAKFKERDFCNYRNTHIGFIFQDYHLIDELTVYENIVLSLDLRRLEDRDKVSAALERVDLAGYEDRYPSELSGGEQQRVAIARAIVKKPRIILADEPTGNLDTNTATAVIKLLKELSKECLILIVSHNINDANNYADRIIELRKGEIISDKSRNPYFADEVTFENGSLVYPMDTFLSDEDIGVINDHAGAKLIKRTDKFIPTNAQATPTKKVKVENKSLAFGKKFNLSGKFLKNKSLAISLSAFMVAVIMVIMALAQTIIAFDGGAIVADEMRKTNQSTLLLSKVFDEETKARLDGNYHVKVDDVDIQSFYDAGYEGKIYPIYNVTVNIVSHSNFAGIDSAIIHPQTLFMTESIGTMVVDEEFLTEKFDELKFCAKLDHPDPAGVYITDYVADSIIALRPQSGTTYEEVIGEHYKTGWVVSTNIINGIIDTGYRERYTDLFDKIQNGKISNTSDLYEDEQFSSFTNEIYEKLGYGYSLNPDFAEAYREWSTTQVLFRQKLVVNDSFEITGANDFKNFMVYGTKSSSILRDAWAYTITPPEIPQNAKYMRVAFGTTGTTTLPPNDVAPNLFVMKNARLVFSDGTSPDVSALDYEKGYWLGLDGQKVKGSHAQSQLSDYIEIPEGAYITEFMTYTHQNYSFYAFYDENKKCIEVGTHNNIRVDLPQGTIRMNIDEYNKIFGTDYTEKSALDFVPHKIKLAQYAYADVDKKNPLFEIEVTVTRLQSSGWYLSSDVAALFAEAQVYHNALYFDGVDGIGAVLDTAETLNYEPQSFAVEGIHTMTKAVDVFVPIFELIAVILCIGVVFILVNFSSKMIGDKMHEIGILKALGAKNTTIGVVFGLQVVLIAVLTCVLATAGYFVVIDLANDVLIESLKRLAPSSIVLDLDFLTFKPRIAMKNCVLIFGLAVASLIIPLMKIKAIKPVKIIKAKE